jgi:MoxR-like ATPase
MIENVGTEPLFNLECSNIEDFIGRRKEMQEVISSIMHNRLVTIKGIPGLGKTTLAKAVA